MEDLRPRGPQFRLILLRSRVGRADSRFCARHGTGRALPPLCQHLQQRSHGPAAGTRPPATAKQHNCRDRAQEEIGQLLEDKVQCSPRGCHPSGWKMAANTSGNYGSNRADFGVSNRVQTGRIKHFHLIENNSEQVVDRGGNGGTLVCISTRSGSAERRVEGTYHRFPSPAAQLNRSSPHLSSFPNRRHCHPRTAGSVRAAMPALPPP